MVWQMMYGATALHCKAPLFSPKLLKATQTLTFVPTPQGNDTLCISVLFINDLKNIIQRLISLKCDRH